MIVHLSTHNLFLYSFLILLKISNSSAEEDCYYDGNDFCVSQDDILSVDLLPGTFLLESARRNEEIEKKQSADNITVGGTYEEALNEMDYHRKRMNEYLCHGFMAEEIVREVRSIRVKRLPDSHDNSMPDFLGEANVTVQEKLLSDEGSSKYKEWLRRTTTLDDVFRHYMPQNRLMKNKVGKKGIPHGFEEFDGEVTGYAIPAPMSPSKTGHQYYDEVEEIVSSPTGHHQYSHPPPQPPPSPHYMPHDFVPVIHEEHYYHDSGHDDDEHYEVHYKGKGELTIKDFFEIALTALAFLAFGLFVIQLLMAINNAGTTAATVTTADATRFRRNAFSSKFIYNNNAELNELSHRVLRSIEAAMVAEYDSGRCLRWTLCRDNQHSKNTDTAQRIWIPVWSVGMSWLAGRMVKQSTWPVMFDTIKASVLGLGGVDCDELYPSCDLIAERRKRRRRRRK